MCLFDPFYISPISFPLSFATSHQNPCNAWNNVACRLCYIVGVGRISHHGQHYLSTDTLEQQADSILQLARDARRLVETASWYSNRTLPAIKIPKDEEERVHVRKPSMVKAAARALAKLIMTECGYSLPAAVYVGGGRSSRQKGYLLDPAFSRTVLRMPIDTRAASPSRDRLHVANQHRAGNNGLDQMPCDIEELKSIDDCEEDDIDDKNQDGDEEDDVDGDVQVYEANQAQHDTWKDRNGDQEDQISDEEDEGDDASDRQSLGQWRRRAARRASGRRGELRMVDARALLTAASVGRRTGFP